MIEVKTVSVIIQEIKSLLEGEFQNILVEGEVSGLKPSASGHWYFNLIDKNSSISAALFKMDSFRNPIVKQLKDGDKIQCLGPISVYGKRGTFQLIVKRILTQGKGDLKAEFEKLKKKLASLGMFDIEHKKKIPEFPNKVAVITSATGAAVHDFLNVFSRRSQFMDLLVIPTLVQGEQSAISVIKSLQKIEKYNELAKEPIDLVVITRGGGSIEDLWSFNDEKLANKIFDYSIPIVSAIGHEVDYTICDYVADLRCETPTAAAEIISQGQVGLLQRFLNLKKSLIYFTQNVLAQESIRLEQFNPKKLSQKLWGPYVHYQKRIERCQIHKRSQEFLKIHERYFIIDEMISRLQGQIQSKYEYNCQVLSRLHSVLNAVAPKNVLERGYTYLQVDKKVVHNLLSFNKIKPDKKLEIVFHDGKGVVEKSSK